MDNQNNPFLQANDQLDAALQQVEDKCIFQNAIVHANPDSVESHEVQIIEPDPEQMNGGTNYFHRLMEQLSEEQWTEGGREWEVGRAGVEDEGFGSGGEVGEWEPAGQ